MVSETVAAKIRSRWLIVAGLVVVMVVLLALTLWQRLSSKDSPLRLGSDARALDSDNLTVKKGSLTYMQLDYTPGKITQVGVRLLDGEKLAFNAGTYTVNDKGTFNTVLATASLEPRSYKIAVVDQQGKTIVTGNLKVTER